MPFQNFSHELDRSEISKHKEMRLTKLEKAGAESEISRLNPN
jgi:hypothetical protein